LNEIWVSFSPELDHHNVIPETPSSLPIAVPDPATAPTNTSIHRIMPKKKKGKKGKKKGKKGKKKARVAPAPYYPVKLDANYRFGNIIAVSMQDRQSSKKRAAYLIQQGGESVRENDNNSSDRRGRDSDGQDGPSRLLRLARLGLDDLPNGLDSLKNLTALDLSGNRLFDIDATFFGLSFCAELRELNLNDNQLTGELRDDICRCTRLEVVSLKRNQITELPARLSENCPAMKVLDVSQNRLKELPGWLPELLPGARWSELQSLDVSGNDLTVLWPNIGVLTGLQQLRCARNTIAAIPSSVGKLKALRLLDFSGNGLLSLPAELTECCNLRTLNISANGLTRIGKLL
jgi:hypothetical protein